MTDLTGKWEVTFGLEDTIPEPAIGYFEQDGNHLTGTFETESGDYRFLEGTVQANKMYLSSFDGAHMFLFEALINQDGTLSGVFRNGIHYITSWSGKRNEEATLRDPNSITTFSDEKFEFAFPDENGRLMTSDDATLAGRPKIVQLLGTWCPNCLDETQFLLDYFERENPDIGLVGLAFELHSDPVMARQAIARYRQKLDIPYPILFAGASDKNEASKQLPMLDTVFAYPTLIFIDSENQVKKIYTGFSGPATPNYQSFKKEFHETVNTLLSNAQ